MAESDEMSRLNCCLDVALNPIGSLALAERLDESEDKLMWTFNVVSPKIVDLILSPYGFRIVESFLNANINDVNTRLAESLSKEWSGLEKVLENAKGRYVCDTLLKRQMKSFAHRIITIARKNWWFKIPDCLPILSKAISISDFDVAQKFTSNEEMMFDLCDSPEGLYCVLKVKGKSMHLPGWKDSLSRLIVLKSESITGSEALLQAILYGDYLVYEMVEILCCRRESYDNLTTVGLVIRLIEQGSIDLKRIIAKCLCEPACHPMICQIRNIALFKEFKEACDSNFALPQRERLDDLLHVSTRVRSVVDDCLTTMKRKAESPITNSQSAAKKPKEYVMEPQPASQNTVSPLTIDSSLSTAAPFPTVPPPTTSTPPIPPPPQFIPLSLDRLMGIKTRRDPGKNYVMSTAMSKQYSVLLSKLDKHSSDSDYSSIIFDCIRNTLLSLMMDENGSKVVKWFIMNGSPDQKEEIVKKVEANLEDLATNGGYGGSIAALAIDNCADLEKKEELTETFKAVTDEKVEQTPERWRRILKEDSNGEMNIANGRTLSDEEARDIRKIFAEIDKRLRQSPAFNCNPGKIKRCITTGVKQDGVSQLFVDLVQERVVAWVKHASGTSLLYGLAQEKVLRQHLAYAVASVLHLLRYQSSNAVLSLMLLDNATRISFVKHCIARNDDSPLVKLFHSDLFAGQCLWIGKACARENPNGVRALINSSHGRSIADTVNGRIFIDSLTKPPPEGFGWTDLLVLLASDGRDPSPLNLPPQATPSAAPTFFFRPPIKIQSESNPTVSRPLSFTLPRLRPPLFQSSLINISPSGTPSFPTVPRISAQNFSFAGLKPASVTPEQAVKDTVEFIVSKVANE